MCSRHGAERDVMDQLLNIWCIPLAIGCLFFVGIPVSLLLLSPIPGEDDDVNWHFIVSPFVGLAVSVVVLQNLTYLNFPVRLSTPFLISIVGILWIWILKDFRANLKVSKKTGIVLLQAIAVFVIHAFGLLILGPQYYVGRAWHDEYTYTCLADFLANFPFNLDNESVQSSFSLVTAVNFKADRIGQSIFHAFLSTITCMDSKSTFGIAILLMPFMVTLASFVLIVKAYSIRDRSAFVGSVAAGVIPAICMVHIECFLSQALVIPLLLIWPFILSHAIRYFQFRNVLVAAFVLSAATSIYTEFYLLFIGVGLVSVTMHCIQESGKWRAYIIGLGLIMYSALILNAGFLTGIEEILQRLGMKNALPSIYPWARTTEGLMRLWIGDLVEIVPNGSLDFIGPITAVLFFAASSGLVLGAFYRRNPLSLSILALGGLPVLVFVRGAEYNYQLYKLLLSVSPLYPIGWTVLSQRLNRSIVFKAHRFNACFRITGVILIVLMVIASASMTIRTGVGRTMEEVGRGGAHKLAAPATMHLQKRLSTIRNQNIYIIWTDDFFGGDYVLNWLRYFARNNYVWSINSADVEDQASNYSMTRVEHLNSEFCHDKINQESATEESDTFLLTGNSFNSYLSEKCMELEWSEDPYYLWKFRQKDLEVLYNLPKIIDKPLGVSK